MREAFDLIRADLGPEAVIISTRKTRGGVEVSAAVDYDAPLNRKAPPTEAALETSSEIGGALRDLRLDLAALRQIVVGSNHLRNETPGRAALFGWLAGRGLSTEIALEVMAAVDPARGQFAVPPKDDGLAGLTETLSRMVDVGGFFEAGAGDARSVFALIGPTGVGKTTMLAKLAARLSMTERRRVGIISCDSYRIGAPDQIRSYARILGLPLAFAESERELPAALAAQADRDVVLVDTAGRSPYDTERLAEIARLGEAGVRSHLVLCATTRDEDMAAAIRHFAVADYQSIIFTKLDEAERLGAVLNAARRARKPISWLGMGQRVPGGLEPADPEGVARFVLQAYATGKGNSAWGRQQQA
ncbi:MAG: AAA family ATPase [Pseudomonadota bacterium]